MKIKNRSKKTALLTGTTSGIGLELSNIFAANGVDLVLVSQNTVKLQAQKDELQKRYSVAVHAIAMDLSAPKAAREAFAQVESEGIKVDFLVNNAGFNVSGFFAETSLDEELKMMHLHMMCLTEMTKLFLPGIIQRRSGGILNVGSTGSFTPVPLDAVYAATKAYILSFSNAIRAELRGTGIHVSTLCPGATNTLFAKKARIENTFLFKYLVMEPQDVAKIAYRQFMKGKKVIIPGFFNKLLVHSMPITPSCVLDFVSAMLLTRRNAKA